ncbi:MFS transporter [Frankia sp. AgKG'84/4]|uniref:MFS transporter n=1 Tax=Frankia sp. AgKG'84/4 TaxID=573490 RepID=UPI00200C149B|nr:MFS transporter [Frankia sp. AgKG'84/4]MCL9796863.1 MFS transporter [Frankia sp. AgKG'84/4]
MIWQLLVGAAGAGTALALAIACRPAAAAARRHGSVPGTVPAATGALAVLAVIGIVLTAFAGLAAWAGACWLLCTAAAAGWIALRRRDPAVWGLMAPDPPRMVSRERMSADLADQDDLVQSLTIASYALQMGDAGRARQAVEVALTRSRATLDVLLREDCAHGFVRSAPAAQTPAGPTAA